MVLISTVYRDFLILNGNDLFQTLIFYSFVSKWFTYPHCFPPKSTKASYYIAGSLPAEEYLLYTDPTDGHQLSQPNNQHQTARLEQILAA